MACRVLFAALFLSVRGLYFPYVMCARVLPDMVAVMSRGDGAEIGPPALTVVCGVFMLLLQLYWGSLIIKQLKKLMTPPPDSSKEDYTQLQDV